MKKFLFIFIILINSILPSISVYFTPSKQADEEILKVIKGAKNSVFIASYNFNYKEIIEILKNKKLDELKIFIEKENNLPFSQSCIQVYKGSNLFHSKFIIVDNEITIVGSGNFTKNDFHLFHNNFLIIKDKNISEYFKEKIFSLWNNKENNKSPFLSETLEIYFSPEENLEEKIIEEIEKAKSSIYFSHFYFSSENIARHLIDKKKKGVEINGIFERYNTSNYSTFYILNDYGINVRKSNMAGFLHDKFFVIDEKVVITGSYNPTVSARKNYETILILRDKEIADKYLKEWRKLWRWESLP